MFARLAEHSDVECREVSLPPQWGDERRCRAHVGVFARRDIAAGELVLHNSPLALVPSSGRCQWCLCRAEADLWACPACTAQYCSALCRQLLAKVLNLLFAG